MTPRRGIACSSFGPESETVPVSSAIIDLEQEPGNLRVLFDADGALL